MRAFERLLSEVSAKYINLPIEEIEHTTRDDFGRLARLLGVDRCFLNLIKEGTADLDIPNPDWFKQFAWWPEQDSGAIQKLQDQGYAYIVPQHWQFQNKTIKGDPWQFTDISEIPEGAKEVYSSLLGIKSLLSVPIPAGGSIAGALTVATTRNQRTWTDEDIATVQLFGEIFVNALIRKRTEASLRMALEEVKLLKDRFEADYIYLKEEIDLTHDLGDIVGATRAFKDVLSKVRLVAPTNSTVLVLGETGTGKGVIARAIHN
ncbi:MAG: sigma 54-interacting transcriptional regulator, partial [Desulfatitalea sp.]|nr:sigma 54-interacting transcriptional regulator [Desulfatitalea sp.]